MTVNIPISIWLIFTLLSMVTGCEKNATESTFATYHQRLANVLDVTPSPAPTTTLIQLPEKRDVQQPIPDIRIDFLDAYQLRKCGLFQLIAERNSILGKVQDQTRMLSYELQLIDGLQYCLETLTDEPEFTTQLRTIMQQKREQLPLVFWNMVFTGQEWRKQFTLSHQLLENNHFAGFVESQAAFRYLANLSKVINAEKSPNSPKINIEKTTTTLLYQQQNIHRIRYLGRLLYSMAHTTDWLNTITAQLVSHETNIQCGANLNQQQAEYLRNVFYKFFATNLQRYLASLDSQYQQLQPDLKTVYHSFYDTNVDISPEMKEYAQYYINGEIYNNFLSATKDHVHFWQRLFKRCHFKVGYQ